VVIAPHCGADEPRAVTWAARIVAVGILVTPGGEGGLAVVQGAMAAVGEELGEFFGRREGDEVSVGADLLVGNLERSALIVPVGVRSKTAGNVDVESLPPLALGIVLTVPTDKDVAFGCHQLERVAQPSPHGHVHHRHRQEGSSRRFFCRLDSLIRSGDHAMNKRGTGILEGKTALGSRIVLDAETGLEHMEKHLGPAVGLASWDEIALSREGRVLETALGLDGHTPRPIVQNGQGMVDIQLRAARQAGGAEQIHLRNINVGELGRRHLEQPLEVPGLADCLG